MDKKRIGLFLAMLIALLADPAPASAVDDNELSIGFIGALSGSRAHIARDQLDGFKLGTKHSGGRLGGVDFDLAVHDDKGDVSLTKRAARWLSGQGKAEIILLSQNNLSADELKPFLGVSNVLLMALSPPPERMAQADCSPNFFSLSQSDATFHRIAALYLANRNYNTVLLAGPDTRETDDAIASFSRHFPGKIIPLKSPVGTMNFDADIKRIAALNPDAVYLLNKGGMAVNFIIQYANSSLKENDLPLFAPPATLDRAVIASSGAAAEGLFSVSPWSDDMDTASNRRMMADFEVEYGRPASIHAAMGYDAAMLLDAAITRIDKKINNAALLRQAMRTIDFPATRPGLKIGPNNFPIEDFVLRNVAADSARGRFGNEQMSVIAKSVSDERKNECPMPPSLPLPALAPVRK